MTDHAPQLTTQAHPSESWDLDSCLRRNVVKGGMIFFLMMSMSISVNAQESHDPVCQIIEQHVPISDVAYQAGVDAYGNAVVPADLNSAAPSYLPETIKVPLTLNLVERMGNLPNGIELDAPLGLLEISQTGHIRYNGQDMTAPIKPLCGQSHKTTEEVAIMEEPVKIETMDNGLQDQDVIELDPVDIPPAQALPPQEVVPTIGQLDIDNAPPHESDIIEGGDYREIYYND